MLRLGIFANYGKVNRQNNASLKRKHPRCTNL